MPSKTDTIADLGPAVEAQWQQLHCHLEWSEGFALGFLFSSSQLVVDQFRDRVDRLCRGRVVKLKRVAADDAVVILNELMEIIQNQNQAGPHPYEHALIWIEMFLGGREKSLDHEREFMLARLNERREMLRRRVRQPMILVFPWGYQTQVRDAAPDLWSIRDFSIEPDNPVGPTADTEGQVSGRHIQMPVMSPSGEIDAPVVGEWQRLRERGALDESALLVGFRAFDALIKSLQLDEAKRVVRELQDIISQGDISAEGIRNRSIALGKLVDSLRSLATLETQRHNPDAARPYLSEARELLQRLNATYPDDRHATDLAAVERQLSALDNPDNPESTTTPESP